MGDEHKDQDHYEVLSLHMEATTSEINSAYRREALKYHPDKNPDNPEAAVKFQKVKKAHEVLKDETERKNFDNKHKAKQQRKKKNVEMESKRKKMTEDLNRREQEAQSQKRQKKGKKPEVSPEDMNWLKKDKPFKSPISQMHGEKSTPTTSGSSGSNTIRVKWSKKKTLTKEDITEDFSKFGTIDLVVFSEEKKKKGRPGALISFKNPLDAQTAMQGTMEGYEMSWPSKQPPTTPSSTSSTATKPTPPPASTPTFVSPQGGTFPSPFGAIPSFVSPLGTSFQSPFAASPFLSPVGNPFRHKTPSVNELESYEAEILNKLRQAAEMQKEPPQPVNTTPGTTTNADPHNNQNKDFRNGNDYESVTMMKLRQAAERQRMEGDMLKAQETS